ncbi:MAG: reverse transcriptase/maturase family protein, partial [Proteiniphilum sp.]|nr:reverse transcriptase/maturase family protein [Proteiniphilum sp.]
NRSNAGVGYQNANNTVSNSNRNISTHLELRKNAISEQHHDQICIADKHTTKGLPCISIIMRKVHGSSKNMKRYGNLFEKIISIDNLKLAHKNARKGKTYYKDIKMIDSDPDKFLWQLHNSLKNKTFTTSPYTTKQIYEPKKRTIYKLPYFPDRIVHHAVMNVLQSIWDRTFIYDLYSAIPGKGIHMGSYRLRQFLRDHENTKYCLKFDVSKFYPSINHDILSDIIKKKIKCQNTLWLLEDIIRSTEGNKNVPIGNYLSQYFSNLYLAPFDHWVKEDLGLKYYIRYCDDGVILHRDRGHLKYVKDLINEYFKSIELTLNPNTTITKVDVNGIDFLGYKSFRNYTLLRKSSARKFKRKIRYLETYNTDPQHTVSSVMSYLGWLRHCDSHHLQSKYVYKNSVILEKMEQASFKLKIESPLRKYTCQNLQSTHKTLKLTR